MERLQIKLNQLKLSIDPFTVAYLVAWPLNESEAGVDLALIEPPYFSYVNDAVLMLMTRNPNIRA